MRRFDETQNPHGDPDRRPEVQAPHPFFTTTGRRGPRINRPAVDMRLRAIVYPASVTRATEAAGLLGYAIGVVPHPSHLVLLATPFRPKATMVARLLADKIREAVGGFFEGEFGNIATAGPHGRLTWNVTLGVGAALELHVYPARGSE